jgi:hypothetical protein
MQEDSKVMREDSKVIREDSYIMKTLAVVALIFLPISTVSSIFGTQFFSTITVADPSPDGPIKSSTYVSSQFWVFWMVAIPLTLAILSGWSLWIRRSKVLGAEKGPQKC